MWVGFVVVVMSSGQVAADAALFPSEAECKETNAQVLQMINEPKNHILHYDMGCYRLDKMKKPGANV